MILVYLVACDIVNVTGHQFKMPVANCIVANLPA